MSRIILIGLGLFHLGNGLFMVVNPVAWYFATPGVAATGPANPHFIIDIGLAYAASGAGLMLAYRARPVAAAFVLAGAIWPALHAALHIVEWFSHGPPADLGAALAEGLGVIAAGLAGLALAVWNFRKQGDAAC